jgi:HAD superfamily hydrolase (TIGR01509 family)
MQAIRNIIFDLGGVILNIDFKKTEAAFKLLGWDSFSDYISQFHISDLFENYETGKIDDLQFVEGISALMGKAANNEHIIEAWNALLLDFPTERIALLKELKTKYRTFLLSNTNAIHLNAFQEKLYQKEGVYLEDLFEKAYYSHVVKLRKPSTEIFELVLNENNLNPAETLFIDDTASNFEGAQKLGIQVFHLEPGNDITRMDHFK